MNAETGGATPFQGQFLGQGHLEQLLLRWAPQPDQTASSVYLRPGTGSQFLETSGPEGRGWLNHLTALGLPPARWDTGLAGLRAGNAALVIIPPFPVLQDRLTTAWDVEPLLALVRAEYTIGVVLLRLGRYAVVVYRGDRLLSSKTDTRYVKGRHHAGGTSQQRFQRIREGQVRRLYDEACQVTQNQLVPYAPQLDYILLGGERFTLNGFLKACPYLEQFRSIILSRRLNIREPKHATLEQVAAMLRESRVYQFRW